MTLETTIITCLESFKKEEVNLIGAYNKIIEAVFKEIDKREDLALDKFKKDLIWGVISFTDPSLRLTTRVLKEIEEEVGRPVHL